MRLFNFEFFAEHPLVLALILMFLGVYVLFCLSLRNLLYGIEPENRKINPELVWLILIPYIAPIAIIFVVIYVWKSVKQGFGARGIEYDLRPTYISGLIYASAYLAIAIHAYVRFSIYGNAKSAGFDHYLVMILSFAALVYSIIYWVNINKCRKVLAWDDEKREIMEASGPGETAEAQGSLPDYPDIE